jgi:hypothetical protein
VGSSPTAGIIRPSFRWIIAIPTPEGLEQLEPHAVDIDESAENRQSHLARVNFSVISTSIRVSKLEMVRGGEHIS